MSYIELSDISFAYGQKLVLESINLAITRGESLALIGPNGSGKSTLLRLLCGVIVAQVGTYQFDGHPINATTLGQKTFAKRFHQRVGFLFQNADSQLFCPSVREEVGFGPRQMGLTEPEIQERVGDCLNLLGISGLADAIPYHLSEGEKRKVALASVLALNPEVLLLDEPLNGLDPRTRRFLGEFLSGLSAAGKTIICATHELETGPSLFQRAVVFSEEHRIVADGHFASICSDLQLLGRHNII